MSDFDLTGEIVYSPDYAVERNPKWGGYSYDGTAFFTGAPPTATPGQECPTCNRRVPKPKTEKSPPTKRVAYWVPADESEAHEEFLDSLAEFLGCYDQPFHRYKAVLLAGVALMQDESWRGFAGRAA